jgi:hypothetical protein
MASLRVGQKKQLSGLLYINLELASGAQVLFESPAKRDYISNFRELIYASRRPAN